MRTFFFFVMRSGRSTTALNQCLECLALGYAPFQLHFSDGSTETGWSLRECFPSLTWSMPQDICRRRLMGSILVITYYLTYLQCKFPMLRGLRQLQVFWKPFYFGALGNYFFQYLLIMLFVKIFTIVFRFLTLILIVPWHSELLMEDDFVFD